MPGIGTHREARKSFDQTFSKGLRLVRRSLTACTGAAGERDAANGAHAPQAIAPGAAAEAPCLPFPPACAKGRHTLSRAGQASHWKSSAGRGPAQEVSPAGSVGAGRCPPGTSAPRRGFLTENSPLDYFPIFLRLPKATKAAGASVSPAGSVGAERLPPANCAPAPLPPLKRWTKLLRFSTQPKRGLVSQPPSASSGAFKRRS